MNLSIVISVYNEEESLRELIPWIKEALSGESMEYEIILIDDGSTDSSWSIIEELSKEYPIKGISFRRNYGKSAALYCGFELAQGDIVVTMDADLQDSPEEIPGLVAMIKAENLDIVSGWKKKRYDGFFSKNLPSRIYNSAARKVTKIKLHDMNCGLKAYKREVVKNIEVYGEMHRYIPYLSKNAGFTKIGEKVVKHQPRKFGKSKFGKSRFINGFLDLLTLWFLSRFGKKPMHFFGLVGSLTFLIGSLTSLYLIINKIVTQSKGLPFRAVTDQPLFYISLVALIIGMQLFLSGFLAELISRNGSERNHYKIKKSI
ncbi:MAG: glycosyl transferase family 2 [Bacteroidetes bacterium GWF2_41_61]|jgi:glycosyltransferase involved in cell wall biosynthesis|nr:MAG: glycosyl transferase family 2 [Bacteroidetes bacterium GWE2_40_15]OFY31372.1 MAG: glycosyl transferase family 2 [Bacteroidetes bacterium GWF2_41_61]OFY88231.1 MAG: glycosyl transferase family 2 [Bacteroidetes bacterium RIFOXYA12_FULL_40_10]PKP06492.1 MAG: glycosyltransferase [Bacteroidetes bacterium HGW-Bacteroidetes-5]